MAAVVGALSLAVAGGFGIGIPVAAALRPARPLLGWRVGPVEKFDPALAQFRPYLGGAVWHGTATRLSDIYLQLFCDDPKSAEIALIEHNVDYEARTVTGFNGEPVEALSLSSMSRELGEAIGIHLLIHDHDDLRGALRPDAKGRTPRGDLDAVRALTGRQ